MYMDARKPPQDIAGFDPVATAGDCHYDAEAAEKAVEFFYDCLTFVKGLKAAEPFHLEPWQADIVRTVIGWKRPDGSRRFRQVFIEVPRKNGKTTLLAGIANYLLFCDAEAGAECYCVAGDRDQAALAWGSAAAMIRKSPSLMKRCKVRDSVKRIIYDGSFLRAIAANEGGAHGFDVHFAVCDELHVWPNRSMFDVIHTGTGARRQPLEVYITTAGWDRNSICWEVLTTARQVRDGQILDDAFLPVIYEATEDEDWTDPAVWRKANPNLGVSVTEEYLARECKKAQENPAYENTFRRLHLNQWTSQESRWIPMNDWRACETSDKPIDKGIPSCGGLDVSAVADFTAWVIVQKTPIGIRCRGHYWLPEVKAREYERTDNLPITAWQRDGWLTLIPDNRIDQSYIRQRIIRDRELYGVETIGFDNWNMESLRIELERDHDFIMNEVRQGFASLSAPSKELERQVLGHSLDHGGDPVLAWMADNAVCRVDENNNVRPVKGQGKKKIDGIVALIMGITTLDCLEPANEAGVCVL